MRQPDPSPTSILRPLAAAAWDHTPAWLPTLTHLLRAQDAAALVPAVGQVQGAGWAAVQPLLQSAGLEARVASQPLSAVIAEGLPVALLLRSGDACLLTACRTAADGRTECSLVLPGLDGDDVFSASVAELSSEYSGQRLRVQRAPGGAGRPQPQPHPHPQPLRTAPVLRSAMPAAGLPRLDELVCTDEALAPKLPEAAAPVHAVRAEPAPPLRERVGGTLSFTVDGPVDGSVEGGAGALTQRATHRPARGSAAAEAPAAAPPSWMLATTDAADAAGAADSPLRRGGAGAWATTGPSRRTGSAALAWGRLQGLREAVSSAAAGLRQGVQQLGHGLAAVATPAAAVPLLDAVPLADALPLPGAVPAADAVPVAAAPASSAAAAPASSFRAALARAAVQPVAAAAAADAVGAAASPPMTAPSAEAAVATAAAAPTAPRVLPVLTEVLHGPQEPWPAGAARPISTRLALGDTPDLWRHTAPTDAFSVLSDLPVLAWPDSWPVIDPDAAVPASADVLLAAAMPAPTDAGAEGGADGGAVIDNAAEVAAPGSARPRKPLRPLPRTAGRVPARTQWCGVPRAQAGRTAAAIGASSPAGAVR